MIYDNILETVWNTPLVKINKINTNKNVNIYAKIEGINPGGSIKDRIALNIIDNAEKKWELTKEKTIIEPTSGNTGIGLAMIGAVRWYKVRIVISENVSRERQKMIRSFWADLVLTDWKKWTDWAIKKARELVASNPSKYFFPDQFSNKCNNLAHYKTTAEEIWKQTNWDIDCFVSSIWTSGTIMWVSSYLKEKNKNIKIVCAYPHKGHYIQWLKNMEEAIVPSIYDSSQIDQNIVIDSEQAFSCARELISKEGIFVGMSSGAAMLAAKKFSQNIERWNIVVIFPDRGEKYLSTGMFV